MSESPTEKTGVSNWNIANVLTVLRILMVPVFVWTLFQDSGESVGWRWAAVAIFALASLTDKIDGNLARSRGLITNLGKILDPIADKFLTGAALISLSVLGEVWWWVTIVILGRELIITAMRFVVIRYAVLPASRGGKLKTVLQMLAIGAFLLPLFVLPGFIHAIAVVLMALALIVTVGSGVDYLFTGYRVFTQGRRG